MIKIDKLVKCLVKRDKRHERSFCDTKCPFIDSEWSPRRCNLFDAPIVLLMGKRLVSVYHNKVEEETFLEGYIPCKECKKLVGE